MAISVLAAVGNVQYPEPTVKPLAPVRLLVCATTGRLNTIEWYLNDEPVAYGRKPADPSGPAS
jgi:hypothetical protein